MANIELKGNLTVNDAEKLHRLFLQNVQQTNNITLDVSKLEDFDVSILQLIISLFATMGPDNKPAITGSFSPKVKKRLYICGIIPDENMDDISIINSMNERIGAAS